VLDHRQLGLIELHRGRAELFGVGAGAVERQRQIAQILAHRGQRLRGGLARAGERRLKILERISGDVVLDLQQAAQPFDDLFGAAGHGLNDRGQVLRDRALFGGGRHPVAHEPGEHFVHRRHVARPGVGQAGDEALGGLAEAAQRHPGHVGVRDELRHRRVHLHQAVAQFLRRFRVGVAVGVAESQPRLAGDPVAFSVVTGQIAVALGVGARDGEAGRVRLFLEHARGDQCRDHRADHRDHRGGDQPGAHPGADHPVGGDAQRRGAARQQPHAGH
jgi:hypothetical protein